MEGDIKVSCFDADFIPFYVCHNKKDEPVKSLEDCLNHCDELIFNVNRMIKAEYYCGFMTIGKCFRYDINPGYKANRKYDNLPNYLTDVKAHMILNHGFQGLPGYEADDLVVSYKKQYKDQNVMIISPDKDILMSVDNAFNPRKWEYVRNTPDEIVRNFWKQMVTGDTIDGIKGIPGKGEAYFNKIEEIDRHNGFTLGYRLAILREYVTHFGEYEGIKEFTKNYLSLKMVDNVVLKDIKLKEVPKPELL